MSKHKIDFKQPLYTIFHPFKGFDTVKWEEKDHAGSLITSVIIVLLWFLFTVVQYFATGFAFNMKQPENFNLAILIGSTIGTFSLWVAANWCVCTLIEGSGKLSEIIICSAWSILPYILSIPVLILCSNILTTNEFVFAAIFSVICMLWSFANLFISMSMIHEYSGLKTLYSMLLTIVAMAIMIFLILLFTSLFRQFYIFIKTIFYETFMRI